MNVTLFCLWGALYILNVGLGFLNGAAGFLKAALVVIAVLSFLPGALLLGNGISTGNRKLVLAVRWICAVSLILTTLFLVIFFLCAAFASETVVNVVFILLSLVSAPMLSGQYWIISLFLWGCLFSATFLKKTPDRK